MKIHDLKIWPVYFEEILEGRKTFEIRLNDRQYHTGEKVLLREWDPTIESYMCPEFNIKKFREPNGYTGREAQFDIGWLYDLEDGRVAFSILKKVAE